MATTAVPGTSLIGESVRRKEDQRFITGAGRYTDDLKLTGQLYAAFVRSPHANATINAIDASAARAMPGVHAVLTGEDMKRAGVNPIPPGWLHPGIRIAEFRPLAVGKVAHVGNAVAVVIADTPMLARDAADAVLVDYADHPAVADAVAALAPGAPQVHADAPGNVAFTWQLGDAAATDAAVAGAKHVVRQHLVNQRLIANAMEPRASLASYDPAADELTLYVTSQNPHVHRLIMGAFVLGIPEHKFRVIAPDVGGGFGSKIFIYPEECVVAWASKTLGRPVKWTATRSEAYLTDAHGRDHDTNVEMAFDAQGKIVALRVKTVANLGAYLTLFAPAVPTYLYGTLLSGQYNIPAIHVEVTAAYTHTTPVDAYRGAGRPEATYVLERTLDVAAHQLGIDPAELRRRNLVAPDAFPFQTAVALQYDSGNYEPALDKALAMVDYQGLRAEQAAARAKGKYLGIGLSSYIEACGLAPSHIVGALGAQAGLYESGVVRIHPTGKVTVFTGSHSHGQGHETTFAQVVASELGCSMDDVEIVHGDTGRVPFGMGTYGSRSGAVGGAALFNSLQKVKEKGRRIAAHLLEAAPEDVDFAGGNYFVKGSPQRTKGFGEVALAAYLAHNIPEGMEPGLEATTFFNPGNFVFPFGTHIAVVEVDGETGHVTVRRYVAVDDFGNVINPMIVDGQLHGGIAQGTAQALWEGAQYDSNGQLLTGSLMNYAIPKAEFLPNFETDRTVTPSPVNPLGVKGAGEAGTIASTAAVANAVIDALSPFGITHLDMPLTAGRIWSAIQDAKGGN
ncbi:MAG TPA: molybdopterin-dependent oxidoreductase [Gemmatimonadaceae bacterium]|nr:MAG: carbon monoxide dehydrogenase [Gemmatimonadetes bacterium SCN 70-22]HMN09059.1 molybdopterin-dependent oxidoreductase [Gemmatimonadaceae bacterium]